LCDAVQEVTAHTVEVAFVDGGYQGQDTKKEAAKHKIKLEVVKVPEAKKGFVLLPKRWVVERSFAWAARFRGRPLPRPPASAAWPRIMNGYPKPSKVSTSSPSSPSCFKTASAKSITRS
jgi:hypothetical protein